MTIAVVPPGTSIKACKPDSRIPPISGACLFECTCRTEVMVTGLPANIGYTNADSEM